MDDIIELKEVVKKYGDKITQEVTGANGEAIQHAVSIKIEFDDE